MQIYEVFGPSANARAAQRQQGEYAASAERSAQKLRRQGYGQLPTSTSVQQLISQVQNDQAAQQLINSWASQWPTVAANIPPAPPPAPPSAPHQSLTIGGQQLDPNDPASARIIAQARAQGR